MAKAKGVLKAITARTYGLYDGDKVLWRFGVLDDEERRSIDPLQGQEVDYDKDIKPMINDKEADLQEVGVEPEIKKEEVEEEIGENAFEDEEVAEEEVE